MKKKTPIIDKFRTVIEQAYGKIVASFTIEHVKVSLISGQGKFIITDAKNIRATGDGEFNRRITATLTMLVAPSFTREVKAKYVMTYNHRRKVSYKATIRELKQK